MCRERVCLSSLVLSFRIFTLVTIWSKRASGWKGEGGWLTPTQGAHQDRQRDTRCAPLAHSLPSLSPLAGAYTRTYAPSLLSSSRLLFFWTIATLTSSPETCVSCSLSPSLPIAACDKVCAVCTRTCIIGITCASFFASTMHAFFVFFFLGVACTRYSHPRAHADTYDTR